MTAGSTPLQVGPRGWGWQGEEQGEVTGDAGGFRTWAFCSPKEEGPHLEDPAPGKIIRYPELLPQLASLNWMQVSGEDN